LLLLSLGITALLLWVIRPFVVAIVMAAVLGAVAHPLYRNVLRRLGGRKSLASGITVALSLVLVIVPLVLFLGIVVGEALELSQSAAEWMAVHAQESETLQRQLEQDPRLKRLLPYQDDIIEKASELASNVGAFAARELADGAKGTAEFFLMLFVTLYAMFFFLVDGRAIVDSVLRFTPLSAEDKDRLLGTFTSVGRATLKGTLTIGVVQGGRGHGAAVDYSGHRRRIGVGPRRCLPSPRRSNRNCHRRGTLVRDRRGYCGQHSASASHRQGHRNA
jgi:predicted PurR-regulated permease PerM